MHTIYGEKCVHDHPHSMHTPDLEYFFDINTCISLCLHHFSFGRLKVVEYLTTEASANLQCKTNDGKTPLDLARS